MITVCFNPVCKRELLYLREGRVVQAGQDAGRTGKGRALLAMRRLLSTLRFPVFCKRGYPGARESYPTR